MEPIQIAFLIGQLLLKYGPDVAEATRKIFKNLNPDVDIGEWADAFSKAKIPYSAFVDPGGLNVPYEDIVRGKVTPSKLSEVRQESEALTAKADATAVAAKELDSKINP